MTSFKVQRRSTEGKSCTWGGGGGSLTGPKNRRVKPNKRGEQVFKRRGRARCKESSTKERMRLRRYVKLSRSREKRTKEACEDFGGGYLKNPRKRSGKKPQAQPELELKKSLHGHIGQHT